MQNALGGEFEELIEAINENFPDIRKKDIDTIINVLSDLTNNTSITNARLKNFVELLTETASSSDLNSFMDTLKNMIDASKRDTIEKFIKKIEEEQKKRSKNISNKEAEIQTQKLDLETRKEKARLEKEAERKGDENMVEKAMEDESKKLYKLDRIKLVRIFQQKFLDSGSVKSYKNSLHERKSLPIKMIDLMMED